MKKLIIVISIQLYFVCSISLIHATILLDSRYNPNQDVKVIYSDPIEADETPYSSNPDHNQGTYDYGDAPAPYGEAKNQMGRWQMLGNTLGVDDGVTWSVNGSSYGTSASLIRGKDVTFRFDFWQANNGSHSYDQLFSTIDWNTNNQWDADETLLYAKIDTYNTPLTDVGKNWEADTDTMFYATITVPETTVIGSTWLRARAHCWHTAYGNITPYNTIGQGETEDYELTVVDPVPEPATMLLFGTGLAGLVGSRLRKKKK